MIKHHLLLHVLLSAQNENFTVLESINQTFPGSSCSSSRVQADQLTFANADVQHLSNVYFKQASTGLNVKFGAAESSIVGPV